MCVIGHSHGCLISTHGKALFPEEESGSRNSDGNPTSCNSANCYCFHVLEFFCNTLDFCCSAGRRERTQRRAIRESTGGSMPGTA